MFFCRLMDLDDLEPIVVACEGLGAYLGGILKEARHSELLASHSCFLRDLSHCLDIKHASSAGLVRARQRAATAPPLSTSCHPQIVAVDGLCHVALTPANAGKVCAVLQGCRVC